MYKLQVEADLKKNNLLNCARLLNKIGFAYCCLEKCDSAENFYDRALEYIHQYQNTIKGKDLTYSKYLTGLINYNLFFKNADPSYDEKSKEQIIANLVGAKKFKDTNQIEGSYYYLAEMEYNSNNTKQSVLYTDSLFMYHRSSVNKYYYSKALSLYAKNCMRLGQLKKADELFHQKYHVENSLNTARTKFNYLATSTYYNVAHNSGLTLSKAKLASQKKDKNTIGIWYCTIWAYLHCLVLFME